MACVNLNCICFVSYIGTHHVIYKNRFVIYYCTNVMFSQEFGERKLLYDVYFPFLGPMVERERCYSVYSSAEISFQLFLSTRHDDAYIKMGYFDA